MQNSNSKLVIVDKKKLHYNNNTKKRKVIKKKQNHTLLGFTFTQPFDQRTREKEYVIEIDKKIET